jgi:hypothetical protein
MWDVSVWLDADLYHVCWFDGMILGTEWNVYILHISRSTT